MSSGVVDDDSSYLVGGEFDSFDSFDDSFERFCLVCERRVDDSAARRPPPPPPTAAAPHPTKPRQRPSPHGSRHPSSNSTTTLKSDRFKALPPEAAAVVAVVAAKHQQQHQPTTTGGATRSHHHPTAPTMKRNKSASKLHGHSRNKSYTSLHPLAPSTKIHAPTARDATATATTAAPHHEPVLPAAATTSHAPRRSSAQQSVDDSDDAYEEVSNDGDEVAPLSALYCSEECRRVDELRGQATTTPSPQLVAVLSTFSEQSRRFGSSSSLAHSSTHSPTTPFFPTSAKSPVIDPRRASSEGVPSPFELDFSAARRRNSRGAETGGYSYRPSLMQRVPSSDGDPAERSQFAAGARNKSSASLSSMDSDRGAPIPHRSSSALSSLRLTQISSSPTRPLYRPSFKPRHHSDAPQLHSSDELPSFNGETTDKLSGYVAGMRISSAPKSRRSQSALTGQLGRSVPTRSSLLAPRDGADVAFPSSSITISQAPMRSNSSASLALMSSSLGQNFRAPHAFSQNSRSASTASLSESTATGLILGTAETVSTSTIIPTTKRRTTSRHRLSIGSGGAASPPLSSPSASSNGFSSTESPNGPALTSSSCTSSNGSAGLGVAATGGPIRGRTMANLSMTRSLSSLMHEADQDGYFPSESDQTPMQSYRTQRPNSTKGTSRSRSRARVSVVENGAPPPPKMSAAPNVTTRGLMPAPTSTPLRKNFSWQDVGVATYAALDLSNRDGRSGEAGIQNGEATVRKPKPKLFHFPDE
ncbi:BZ3500_MvSof-1268-A1-R1_Chr3-3g06625 [Microbotryum saponariae]|uniref:BZ3500_MvSof-1268-A1-R1_Chr3-3g06625 protein n=1 Tax=Microbotryum saponariae TaxID=289078 RepID=A0A2X0NAV2_9BASI|nr:BZ3500_MvSof-1268-A1-R1_Chr3-3g06625 [Microbotryum saponariae]SDA04592.1 BZ3501_MvSof-1269-A2-R1_Chr3-2g06312 [Microbotryum saponariae]